MTKILFVLFVFCMPVALAQNGNYYASVESIGGYTTSGVVPFWLRANQFGSIPLDGPSASFIASAHKEYHASDNRIIDWSAAFECRANLGHTTKLLLIEGYVKLKVSVFDLQIGRSRDMMGLVDSLLSVGAWAISGTSLGIPKVQISNPEFYSIPFLDHIVAFKGNYSHGWFGDIPYSRENNLIHPMTYLHQKSLYGRFGKPNWALKLYGGFNHQVMWGSENEKLGQFNFDMSLAETYWYVITSKSYKGSRFGNSLGSIDLGAEYSFQNLRLFAYRQNLYEAGALYYLANILDGLNGLILINLKTNSKKLQWKRVVLEFLYTKNQAGETWSKFTPSGDENYFNQFQYLTGWSYKGLSLGNPFISPKTTTRSGFASHPNEFFINNRVIAYHLGFMGILYNWQYNMKLSYSQNYGTYLTSEEGGTMGNDRYPPQHGIFGEKKQFSAYLAASKEIKKDLQLNIECAADIGELYYNSFGLMLGLKKTW